MIQFFKVWESSHFDKVINRFNLIISKNQMFIKGFKLLQGMIGDLINKVKGFNIKCYISPKIIYLLIQCSYLKIFIIKKI